MCRISTVHWRRKDTMAGAWRRRSPWRKLEREVSLQAAVTGFTGDFWIFALIALAALPLLLFIRKPKQPRSAADRAEAMVIAE
jgi:hypothetical protein